MDAEWISRHALSIWAVLLALALVGTDLAWRRAVRRREGQDAAARRLLRPVTVIAVVVATLTIAAAIAVEVREAAGLTVFDAALAQDLRSNMPLPALRVIALLTHAGDPLVVGVATLIVFVALLWRRHVRLAAMWIAALVGTALINSALKAWFQRERPLHDHGFIIERSYSFPSGHASGSMVFYGMLAYVLLVLAPPRWHRAIVVAAVAMITLVGISRILLQVHYFSDVMAGYATGLAWVTLCAGSAEYVRLREGRRATT
ncbi:undecaprenyl-diphosphatase [Luteibacter sp. UNCMF366Tsu5.1]|uniref:undecaprenyl-diphosphate phosphatase n=2 Tax=Luteibacter TaxID=242605 RepID=A0ABY4T2Y7_9GAMM|nr:phosphatase PAP2 family protein [Luteibacter flocculans]URL59298.1 phosphatase PAP2 family protein [Luteibacter flocculans]SFW59626.1 undecaprenyl-diphosphatase [Luteibacter sp. UNCMF366Tsu5.1]